MCTKFQFDILKNGRVLPFWMPKKATSCTIYENFGIFSLCRLPDFGRSESVFGVIFAVLTKIWHKNMYHTTQTQNLKFELFDLVTLDDLDLIYGHKRLGGYLEIPQTRSMSFHRLYFNLIRLLFLAKRAMTDTQNFDLWTDLWRYQWRSDEISQHIQQVQARGYQMPLLDRELVH